MISFQEALNLINQEVSQLKYPSKPKNLYAPIHYILSLKSKKVRPVLTLLGYDLYQKQQIEKVISPALAWEIFHNFTLMHDDVMDKADIRRSQPTVHKVWGENNAILSGDAMLILAYQYMTKAPLEYLKPLLNLFSDTAAEICQGQQYDMGFETRLDVNEDEYIEMIRLKTAVLLGAALKTGAIIGGAGERDTQHIYDFGMNIGLAFQIKDDLLDVYGDPAIFGKSIGGDILSNKKTYLLVNALARTDTTDKEYLLKWIHAESFEKDKKIEAVTNIYNKVGIKEIAEKKMDYFYKKALTSLSLLNVKEESKLTLSEFAEKLMFREF